MRSKKPAYAIGIAISSVVLSARLFAAEYTAIDAAHSKIGFTYTEMGVQLTGGFAKFSSQLAFDPAKPQEGHIDVDVAMSSVDAGSAEATYEVVGKEWFDTAHYPSARFASTSISNLGSGRFQLSGNLTIKGHTHAIAVPVTLITNAGQSALEAAFTFNRTDYGVGEGEWADTSTVANEIRIQVRLVLMGAR